MGNVELLKAFEELQERHKFLVEKCDDMYSILKAQQEEIENLRQTCQSMMEGIVVSQPRIIRCKDCKHATMTSDGKMCKYCEMDTDDFGDQRDVYHDADWFCANGERRSDND